MPKITRELILPKINKNLIFSIGMAAMIVGVCKKTLRRWETDEYTRKITDNIIKRLKIEKDFQKG